MGKIRISFQRETCGFPYLVCKKKTVTCTVSGSVALTSPKTVSCLIVSLMLNTRSPWLKVGRVGFLVTRTKTVTSAYTSGSRSLSARMTTWKKKNLFVCSGLTSLSWHCLVPTGEPNAHFYSAALLKSQPLYTISHPVALSQHYVDQSYLYPVSPSDKRAASTIFNDFGMTWPGIKPVTCSPDSGHSIHWATSAGFKKKSEPCY